MIIKSVFISESLPLLAQPAAKVHRIHFEQMNMGNNSNAFIIICKIKIKLISFILMDIFPFLKLTYSKATQGNAKD